VSARDLSPLLAEALRLRALGLSVIPLHAPGMPLPKGREPDSAGKAPMIPWKAYQNRLATEGEIHRWWSQWPHANIGVVTGKVSGVVVVDVDGPEGQATLRTLAPVPPTWRSRTGKGEHLWFKHPGGATIQNFAKRRPGLDLRADGGLVVAPPSRHPSGVLYEWALAPEDVDLADPPPWFFDLLHPPADDVGPRRSEDEWLRLLQGAPEGQRHDVAVRIAGHFLGLGSPPSVVEALLLGYASQCRPPHDPDDVRRIVRDLAAKDQHNRTQGDSPYRVESGRLCREKATAHGSIVEPLCNFTATGSALPKRQCHWCRRTFTPDTWHRYFCSEPCAGASLLGRDGRANERGPKTPGRLSGGPRDGAPTGGSRTRRSP